MSDQRPEERITRDDRAGAGPDEPTSPPPVTDGPSHDPSGVDEQELRRLLRQAVDDLEPSPHALERLQHAVPARRRRKRMVAGAVAVAAVLGVSLPVVLHSGVVAGLSGDDPATTAQGGDTVSPPGGEHPTGGHQSSGEPSPRGEHGSGGAGDEPSAGTTPSPDSSEAPDHDQTFDTSSPSCSRDQLADGGSRSDPADPSGRISGLFVVVNTSAEPCTISDPGMVAASVQGAKDRASVQVLDNTGGLRVDGLPAPEEERDELVLRPQESYVIRFVWLPREGGGPTGCDDSATTSGGDSSSGVAGQGEAPPATEAPGGDGNGNAAVTSVLLGYTPGAGEPRLSTLTLPGACAGTVYRSGLLPNGD